MLLSPRVSLAGVLQFSVTYAQGLNFFAAGNDHYPAVWLEI